MKVEAFRAIYRRQLEHAGRTLHRRPAVRADRQLTQVIRPAVAAESDFRLKRFDLAISTNWVAGPRDGAPEGPKAPVHQLNASSQTASGRFASSWMAKHKGSSWTRDLALANRQPPTLKSSLPNSESAPKRQRTGALQDLADHSAPPNCATAPWSAVVLCRFGRGVRRQKS